MSAKLSRGDGKSVEKLELQTVTGESKQYSVRIRCSTPLLRGALAGGQPPAVSLDLRRELLPSTSGVELFDSDEAAGDLKSIGRKGETL